MIFRATPSLDKTILAEQKDVHAFPPVPMVYESVPAAPLKWEYHVLSIDLREYDLPSVDELNELGEQGWVLVSVLSSHRHLSGSDVPLVVMPGQIGEMMGGSRSFVHYYFVREKGA